MRPDELFFLNGYCFVIEADRNTEPNHSFNRNASWAKKLDQYAYIFRTKAYQHEWDVRELIVLNIFTSPVKAENVRRYLEDGNIEYADGDGVVHAIKKSRSLFFAGNHTLDSHERTPLPLMTILDDLWNRAGHPPATILSALEPRKEVRNSGYAKTA